MGEGDENGSPMSNSEQLEQQLAVRRVMTGRDTHIGQSQNRIVKPISMDFDDDAKAQEADRVAQ